MFRACLFVVLTLAALLFVRAARADKVAVLPFSSGGNATQADLDRARDATRAAAQKLGHKLPTESEMLTAQMAVKNGGPSPSSEQLRAAGRASSADWVAFGRVTMAG